MISHGLPKEVHISILHVFGHMSSNIGNVGVICEASHESLGKVPHRFDRVLDAVTESESLNSAPLDIFILLLRFDLKGELGAPGKLQQFKVLHFSVCKQDSLRAKKTLFAPMSNINCEFHLGRASKLHVQMFEATSFEFQFRLNVGEIAVENGQKVASSGVGAFRISPLAERLIVSCHVVRMPICGILHNTRLRVIVKEVRQFWLSNVLLSVVLRENLLKDCVSETVL